MGWVEFRSESILVTFGYLFLPSVTFPYVWLTFHTFGYLSLPSLSVLTFLTFPYISFPLITFPYLSLPFLTFSYLFLPFLTVLTWTDICSRASLIILWFFCHHIVLYSTAVGKQVLFVYSIVLHTDVLTDGRTDRQTENICFINLSLNKKTNAFKCASI